MFEEYQKLSSEQENIIRRYVVPEFFSIEAFIQYLSNYEIINFDIFTQCSMPGKRPQFSFLRSYRPVSRDVFIRRIPFYFFDLRNTLDFFSLTDLFEGYIDFSNQRTTQSETSDDGTKLPAVAGDYSCFNPDVDFEPLYEMLEKVVYTYKVPLDRALKYLLKSFGRFVNFKYFYHWLSYLDLLDEVNEDNVFPKSLYYAFNKELISKGKSPRLVMPDGFSEKVIFNSEEKCQMFRIGGFFPIEDGKPIMEWIGLWLEECGDISIQNRPSNAGSFEDYILLSSKAESRSVLEIRVNPKSRIFELTRKQDKDGISHNYWRQIFAGSQVSEFTMKPLMAMREKLKLSQKEVAELADINLRSYQRMEAGNSTPDALNLIELMTLLGINGTEAFIAHPEIVDDDYSKFKSGEVPSTFLNREKN